MRGSARARGSDWALGVQARSRALVSDGDAENLYRGASDRLGLRVDLGHPTCCTASVCAASGADATPAIQLGSAYEIFDLISARAFAERTRIELRESGGQARGTRRRDAGPLTAQEALIACLAVEGASNPQIAAQPFIRFAHRGGSSSVAGYQDAIC